MALVLMRRPLRVELPPEYMLEFVAVVPREATVVHHTPKEIVVLQLEERLSTFDVLSERGRHQHPKSSQVSDGGSYRKSY